jgi:hypothetical protein
MDPTQELIDEIYREKVERARREPMHTRMADGVRLFDFVVRIMKDGIRMQFPDADEDRVQELVRERLLIQRRNEAAR